MKKWLPVIGVLIVAAGAAVAYSANVFPKELAPIPEIDRAGFSGDKIEAGENLARLGDCSACHTPVGSRAMSGGFGLPTPFGTIYSTNITPDRESGIGSWSLKAFVRAMREGIDREGNHLYPAFPYDHFAAMTDADLEALYQFLMSREAVATDPVENDLAFPFSFRPILAGWKLLFHRVEPFQPNPDFTDEENRGAYIAETLGHCSACHSPRNMFGAVKTDAFLAGGAAEGWLAPPLGDASIAPAGWTFDEYLDYLFDGWSETHGLAGGPMTAVVDNLYDADEDDVFAIAAWLARITPDVDEEERAARLEAIGARDLPKDFGGEISGQDLPEEVVAGAQVFANNCVKCHRERVSDAQPVSFGLTYAVNAPSPDNVFNAVLHGLAPTIGASERKMDPVKLGAGDLAAVAAFLRWQFTDLPPWPDLAKSAEAAVAVLQGGQAE